MTLLRRRTDRYVWKGEIREFFDEQWADADGVILHRCGFTVLGRVAPAPKAKGTREVFARLEGAIRRHRAA